MRRFPGRAAARRDLAGGRRNDSVRAMDQDDPPGDPAKNDAFRAMHDLGGVSQFMCDRVDTEPHALTEFDREVDAIRQLLGMKKVMSVDELRRGIEAIPEAEYHRLGYYQRWIRSIADNLLAKGVITEAELRATLEQG